MNICSAANATSQPELITSSEVCNKEKGVLQRQVGLKKEQTKDHIHTTVVGLDIEPHLVQDAFLKANSETQWMPSSAIEVAKAPEHTEGPVLPDLYESFQEKKPGEFKDQSSKSNHPPKKFSLLDIIDDDRKSGCQERSPMEVYAAFSLEGTGKIRDQTPNNFAPMEQKSSVFTRVDDLGFNLPAMPMNASSQGWEDENHKKKIFSEKCSTSELFTPPIGSRKKEKISINEREFQEISHIFSWDGCSQTNVSFMDFIPLQTDSSMLYDNCLRDSSFPNARCVMDEISNMFSGEDNSYWSTITLNKEQESKGKSYKFNRKDIQMASINFSENITLNNKPHHNGVCKMASLRNNVNGIATDLDCSSSSTFNPHFTTNFGTENGDDIWDTFSIDETLSTNIGNNSWLYDVPVERNWSQFENMPRHLADFLYLRTESYSVKDIINDELEIDGYRTILPYSPNFHNQRLCEMQDDTTLEQFGIDSSRAMSGDSQTSPYLGEFSFMLKKSDLSLMKSHPQTKMKVTMNVMSELMNDKRDCIDSSSFNSRCSYDETFQSKFPTTSRPESEKSKSIVLGKMELAKEGNKSISSPLYFLEREEKMKYLAIPQNEDQNNCIKNLDNRIKLNTIFSSNNVEKKFRSADQCKCKDSQRRTSQDSENKSVDSKHKSCSFQKESSFTCVNAIFSSKNVEKKISSADQDKCKDSQRTTSQDSDERYIDSKHKSCSLQIESSFTCVHGQEIIQPRVTQNHIDEDHHLEVEEAQTKEKETQKAPVFHEYEHLTMCSKENLDAKPKRLEDCKTQGLSKEGYPNKQSRIDLSSLPVMNGNKIEPQENKPMMDDVVSMEYQAMLESYILQLSCMNKALQQTLDEEIFDKGN
ncbi:uncharacterized protein LOC131061662 [Cryptomeria japonica]|uniref:uncharacterized protein LOC131061662 n=1 Tax=Cryptomeria japonica TaxID=3369 RepID=UPI0027D9F83D|nr:uncharacterized protein LOC131061662 [Cryptomeria japonica]